MSKLVKLFAAFFITFYYGKFTYAQSAPTRAECVAEANVTFNQTLKIARETRSNSIFVCKAGSPQRAACLLSCIQNRTSCVKPIDDSLRACNSAADNSFISGREACRVAAGCTRNCGGNTVYQTCMVNVRVAFYNASRSCRLSDNKGARKTCRDNFKTCNKSCG